MEKYASPFFGHEGLTSTSADHIANIAKDYYEAFEAELKGTNFIKEEISVVGSLDKTETNKGTPEILSMVDTYMDNIIAAKSLIAWLREGIKLKKSYDDKLNTYRSEEYCNLEYPQRPEIRTRQEILESWDVKDRERYLTLETECAVIGTYIHPRGAFDKAKKNHAEKCVKPVDTLLQGRDTIITYYTPLYNRADIEDKLAELQDRHRNAQAELNGYKNRLDREEKEEKDRVSREYMQALDEYKVKLDSISEADKLYVEEERKKIESLRIVIPPHHKRMYDILTKRHKA